MSRSPKLTQIRRFHKRNCRWFLQESKNQNPSLDTPQHPPHKSGSTWASAPQGSHALPGQEKPPVLGAGEGVGRWAGGAVTLTKPHRHRNEDLMHLQ